MTAIELANMRKTKNEIMLAAMAEYRIRNDGSEVLPEARNFRIRSLSLN